VLIGVALHERLRHDQRKNGITEELEAFVVAEPQLGMLVRIAAVRERLPEARQIAERETKVLGKEACGGIRGCR
jgi:hypothetical protein